jgi:hypothetical protein
MELYNELLNTFNMKKIIFLSFLLSTVVSRANIVYMDLTPDSILATPLETINIDLDNNAVTDFSFFYDQYNGNPYLHINTKGTNFVVGSAGTAAFGNDEASPLQYAANIGNASTWVYSPQNLNGVLLAQVPSNYNIFAGLGDRYIGLKFKSGNNTLYGWFLVNVNAAGNNCTIKSFAYQDIPDMAIGAGSEEVGINSEETILTPQLFPNPALDFLWLKNIPMNSELYLLNAEGQVARSASVSMAGTAQFSLNGLAKGVYFIRVENENLVFVRRLIIE